MKSFKFISIHELDEEQLFHIVELLLEAEYGDNQVVNEFNMLCTKFDRLQIIKPYMQHTYLLMNKDEIVGFFIATTKSYVKEISRNISGWRKNDPELISCLNFYMHEALDKDFILHYSAIAINYRGLGVFKILKNYMSQLAKNNGCKRMIFTVRSSSSALNIFEHYGAKIIGEIDSSNKWFNDKLIKYYFVV